MKLKTAYLLNLVGNPLKHYCRQVFDFLDELIEYVTKRNDVNLNGRRYSSNSNSIPYEKPVTHESPLIK